MGVQARNSHTPQPSHEATERNARSLLMLGDVLIYIHCTILLAFVSSAHTVRDTAFTCAYI